MARCAAAPDVMWMQHHAGIYRSADAGAQWTRLLLPCDDFGFAVAAHPRDAQTAWFVPAIKDEIRMPRDGALCVSRTNDGGKTWQIMREGLPQRDAYDLVYRHGFDVDETGSRLAARHGLDNRRAVDQRRRRRALGTGQCASAADLRGELYLAHSLTIMPSVAVSYGTSARRDSMSLLIWVSTRRFGRI
jgi:hypothetical protein